MESIKNWMRDAANILFDDSKNDLRALPKTVRLQILLVLSLLLCLIMLHLCFLCVFTLQKVYFVVAS